MKKELTHLGFVSNGVFLMQRDGAYYGPPFYLRLHEGLLRMFPRVTFYCSLAPENDPLWMQHCTQKYELPNLRICPVPLQGGRLWRGLQQMNIFRRTITQTDVVCIDLPSELGFFASLVCRAQRQKYFVRVLGNWGDSLRHDAAANLARHGKIRLADWMERTVVQGADLAFFQGRELLRKHANYKKEIPRSDRVHSTLSAEMFAPRSQVAFHSPLRLLTVSRLVPLKGLDVLLQAMRHLSERNIALEWWCVGDGPARSALAQLADELGQRDNVRFFGNVQSGPDLFRLYREADIFVLPSRTEGISQALLEALAHSLPVVASAVGGIPGVLTHQVNGLLVPPDEPQALAQAILNLIEQPALTAQIQAAGFAEAQHFRADLLRQGCREMIETTFGQIGPPSPEPFVIGAERERQQAAARR